MELADGEPQAKALRVLALPGPAPAMVRRTKLQGGLERSGLLQIADAVLLTLDCYLEV